LATDDTDNADATGEGQRSPAGLWPAMRRTIESGNASQ